MSSVIYEIDWKVQTILEERLADRTVLTVEYEPGFAWGTPRGDRLGRGLALNLALSAILGNYKCQVEASDILAGMAELVGSVIGIIGAGTKVAIVLFQIATELGSSGEEAQWLGSEISVFCAVLGDLKGTLEKAQDAGFSLDSLTSMRHILDHCHTTIERMQALLGKLTKAPQSENDRPALTAAGRAKWLFLKSRIHVLRTRLESSKLTLTVMMTGFDWALLLEQKEQSTMRQQEAERQASLYQSLLLTQQFLLQRLEILEASNSAVAASDEVMEDDFGVADNRISTILNSAVFDDGLNATQRQWTSRPPMSTVQCSATLQRYASALRKSAQDRKENWDDEPATPLAPVQPPQKPQLVRVAVVFRPLTPKHHHHFNKEPTGEKSCMIEVDKRDGKGSVKDKALKAMEIPYSEPHYDLHMEDRHLDECQYDELWEYLSSGKTLTIQNTLWERCRNDTPDLNLWAPNNLWKWTLMRK